MMMKHTPGPWEYAMGKGLGAPKITTVAWCCEYAIGLPSDYPGGNYRDGEPSGAPEADARLISAAPEMYAAISRQVENIERWLDTGQAASPDESHSIYEQLKAALIKARGQDAA